MVRISAEQSFSFFGFIVTLLIILPPSLLLLSDFCLGQKPRGGELRALFKISVVKIGQLGKNARL
jgi:hypothetical protein